MDSKVAVARVNLQWGLRLGAVAFLITAKSEAGVSGVDADCILVSVALGLAVLNAVLAEGYLLADADVTLDAEVAVLAALCAGLVASLLVGAASRLFLVGQTDVGLIGDFEGLIGLELKVG